MSTHPDPAFLDTLARQLSDASQEILTPLNGISGALELLEATGVSEPQQRYLELIRASLRELEKTAGLLAGLAESATAPGSDGEPLPDINHLPVLNEEQLNVLREEGLLGSLIGVYRETAEKAIREIEAAFEAQDADALSSKAHLLKGSSSNFGAERLVHLCQTLEFSAREKGPSYNKKLIEAIKKEYGCVSRDLTFN